MEKYKNKTLWQERACKAIISEIRRAKARGWVITTIGDFEPYIANYLAKTGVLTGYEAKGYMTWKYLSAWSDMVKEARRFKDQSDQNKKIETNIEIIKYSMSGQYSREMVDQKTQSQWDSVFDSMVIDKQARQDLETYMKWVQDTYKIMYPKAKPSQSLGDTLEKLLKIEPTIPAEFPKKTKDIFGKKMQIL